MSISNEQLLAFIKKNPIGVGCGLLSIALVAAIYFRSDLVPTARAERDTKDARSSLLAANLKYGKDLPEQFQQFNDDIKAIESRLIRAKDLVPNGQYFYSLESATGVHIVLTQSTTSTQAAALMKGAKSSFAPISFQLTITGSYPQVLDALSRLENGLHFSRVLAASCRKAPGATNAADEVLVLSLTIELLGLP